MSFKSSSFPYLAVLILFFSAAHAFDIAQMLTQYPEFSSFKKFLTDSKIVDQINSRKTVTVMVLDNAAMTAVAGKSPDTIKAILMTHVILDYYDEKKLMLAQGSNILLTTLHQTTGIAVNNQGFIKVALVGEGEIAFGCAAPGSPLDVKLVQTVTTQPYDISILQVTKPITWIGQDAAKPAGSGSQGAATSPAQGSNTPGTGTGTGSGATKPVPSQGAATSPIPAQGGSKGSNATGAGGASSSAVKPASSQGAASSPIPSQGGSQGANANATKGAASGTTKPVPSQAATPAAAAAAAAKPAPSTASTPSAGHGANGTAVNPLPSSGNASTSVPPKGSGHAPSPAHGGGDGRTSSVPSQSANTPSPAHGRSSSTLSPPSSSPGANSPSGAGGGGGGSSGVSPSPGSASSSAPTPVAVSPSGDTINPAAPNAGPTSNAGAPDDSSGPSIDGPTAISPADAAADAPPSFGSSSRTNISLLAALITAFASVFLVL